mgnify:FL=1
MYISFKHSITLIMASSFFLCNVFSIYGADLSQILLTDTSKTSEEMEKAMRAALDREYQVDVPTQAGSDGPRRTKKCFSQDVDIVWDGAQKDKWGRNEIHGTEGDDVIRGTDQADLIVGHGGDDIICGGAGDDWIYGDDHDFNGVAGYGLDLINGEAGEDRIFGGGGSDWLHGGDGDDGLFGSWDDDHLFGDNHTDFLVGMSGEDVHHGGNGDDTINAQEFDNSWHDESYGDEGYDHCHVDTAEKEAITLTLCEVVIPH